MMNDLQAIRTYVDSFDWAKYKYAALIATIMAVVARVTYQAWITRYYWEHDGEYIYTLLGPQIVPALIACGLIWAVCFFFIELALSFTKWEVNLMGIDLHNWVSGFFIISLLYSPWMHFLDSTLILLLYLQFSTVKDLGFKYNIIKKAA